MIPTPGQSEQRLDYGDFDYARGAALTEADFFEKPILLLLGQSGAGKTSFVKYLTDANYAGSRIGGFDAGKNSPPATDSFVVVMNDAATVGASISGGAAASSDGGGFYGTIRAARGGGGGSGASSSSSHRVIPGNILCADARFPFRELTRFGNVFMKKLHAAASSSPVLDHLVIVDTPGVFDASSYGTGGPKKGAQSSGGNGKR